MNYIEDRLGARVACSSLYTHHLPAIGSRHLAVTFNDPTAHPAITLLKKHLRAAHKKKPSQQKLPASHAMLQRTWDHRFDSLRALIHAASATTAFTLLLRSKEYSAKKPGAWDPAYQSARRDLVFHGLDDSVIDPSSITACRQCDLHGFTFRLGGAWLAASEIVSHAVLTIHGSKTGGAEDWKRSLTPSGNAICALTALLALRCLTPTMPESAPLFSLPGGYVLTYDDVRAHVKWSAAAAGLDPDKCSTHSYRSGGASHLLAAGVPPDIIKALGRWRSSCFLDYAVPSVELFAGLATAATDPINLRFLSRV